MFIHKHFVYQFSENNSQRYEPRRAYSGGAYTEKAWDASIPYTILEVHFLPTWRNPNKLTVSRQKLHKRDDEVLYWPTISKKLSDKYMKMDLNVKGINFGRSLYREEFMRTNSVMV